MPSYTKMIARGAERLPLLKRLPMVELLMAAEVIALAKDHYERLTVDDRRRLVVLLRTARGRPSQLTADQQAELQAIVAKAAPRHFAATAVDKLSPVPVPAHVKRRIAGPGAPPAATPGPSD
jgi:hypothetical protein